LIFKFWVKFNIYRIVSQCNFNIARGFNYGKRINQPCELDADCVPAVETAGYVFSLDNFNITRGFNHGKRINQLYDLDADCAPAVETAGYVFLNVISR